MVMWEETLLNLPAEPPRFERREHATRFRTLQTIARQYRAHPERFGVVNIWRPKDLYSMTLVAGGQTIRHTGHAPSEPFAANGVTSRTARHSAADAASSITSAAPKGFSNAASDAAR